MRSVVIVAIAVFAMTGSAGAQVFYPQPAVVPSFGPAFDTEYETADNLDVTLEVEAFTTNWGEGYSGVSYGVAAELDLSPSLSLELDGKRVDTTLGSAYEYGAGLNIHGRQGELYAAINSVAMQPDGLVARDQTWIEVGSEYMVNNNLTFGFEASTTLDGAVVPYDSIYTPNALNQYR